MSQSTTTHPEVAPSPTLPHARRKGGRFSIRLFPIVASTEKKQLVSAKALPPSRAGEGWGGVALGHGGVGKRAKAKTLAIKIPESIILRATEVIR